MSTQIHGADYVPHFRHTSRTRHEWQQLMASAIRSGGFRRMESDKLGPVTFIHGPDGKIRHEIHDNVTAPEVQP